LLLTLDGTAFTFYGDELGLKDVQYNSTDSDGTVREQRGQLTPMQWNNSVNAGFSRPNVKPWIPISDSYHDTNVQTQESHGAGVNQLRVFRQLVSVRRVSESLQWGTVEGLAVQSGVLIYVRHAVGFEPLLVAINFGPSPSTIDFREYQEHHLSSSVRLPLEMKIVTSTQNFDGAGREGLFKNGTVVSRMKMIHLRPAEGVVLSWAPNAVD